MNLFEFQTEAETLIEQFQTLIDQLPQKGNTASECQKMQLQQALNELEHSVSGTEEADLEDDEGKKTYLTNCVNAPAELIEAMVEDEVEIEYSELLEHVGQAELNKVFPMYKDTPNLTLESDWSVKYFESTYDGEECVFVRHSAQEYVFTLRD